MYLKCFVFQVFLIEWIVPPRALKDVRQSFLRAFSLFKDAVQGQVLLLMVVQFLKLAVSEPRPHFIETCEPNLTADVCAQG